jgi:hypothetical protein
MLPSSVTSPATVKTSTARTGRASSTPTAPPTSQSASARATAAPRGHNSIANDLKSLFAKGRPLVERWLDIGEEFAALRDAATAKGIDWSQVKALLKAQVQDERGGESKRVARIVEKADYASSYAELLGLGGKLNEKNYSGRSRHTGSEGSESAVDADSATDSRRTEPLPASQNPVIAEEADIANGQPDSPQPVDAPGESGRDTLTAASSNPRLHHPSSGAVKAEGGGDQVANTQPTGTNDGKPEAPSRNASRPTVIPPPTFDELEIPECLRRSAETS